jgi:hypothetical protein
MCYHPVSSSASMSCIGKLLIPVPVHWKFIKNNFTAKALCKICLTWIKKPETDHLLKFAIMKNFLLGACLVLLATACNTDVSSMSIRMDFGNTSEKELPVLYFIKGKDIDTTNLQQSIVLRVDADVFEDVHNTVKAKLSEPTLYEEQENVVDDDKGGMMAAYSVRNSFVALQMLDDIIELMEHKATGREMSDLENVRDMLK